MKRFFDPNSPLMRMLAFLFDIMLLSVCWFLCSLPLATGGAAIAALAQALIGVAEQEPCHLTTFFQCFARTWKKATVFWGTLLLAGGILLLDLYIAGTMTGGLKFLVLTGSCFILFCMCILSVVGFLLLGRDPALPLKKLLVNALLLGIYKLPWTVLVLAVLALPLVTFFVNPVIFFGAGPIWIFLWPAGTMYLAVKVLKP